MSIINKITPKLKQYLLLTWDILFLTLSLTLSFALLLPLKTTTDIILTNLWLFPFFLGIKIILSFYYKLYSFLWRYASTKEFVSIFKAYFISQLLICSILFVTHSFPFTQKILFLDFCFSLLATGTFRASLRLYRDHLVSRSTSEEKKGKRSVFIIGAGEAGNMIAREITRNPKSSYKLIGFLDDKKEKIGNVIHQVPVIGSTKNLKPLIIKHDIEEIILAIPSANGKVIRKLSRICNEINIPCKTTPRLSDIMDEKVSVSQLRNVNIEDLLGRESIQIDNKTISEDISNKTVLVTGAGGSIGAELCRQLHHYGPKKLILLDHSENSVYHIELELQKKSNAHLVPVVLDVKDKSKLESVFSDYHPEIIFHAAAHKHVPLMEANVPEAIENNILGTKNVIELAHHYESENMVLISTDKAVRPTSCMGATKRICELLIQLQAQSSKTKFSAVRFGNVLGSQGSVIPLFKKQIKEGGPITVTHKDMIRYFMTIPEAVSLVIQTSALSKGGEIFILDMGEPVKIMTLAHDLIKLSGLEEGVDIDIEITGSRPGEKLFEELYFDKKALSSTPHEKIFVTKPYPYKKDILVDKINKLLVLAKTHNARLARESLFNIVESALPIQEKSPVLVNQGYSSKNIFN